LTDRLMQCVILAAGYGSRMGALTEDVPKPMLRIYHRPLLDYKIHVLPPDITQVIFVVGYKSEQVIEYFGTHVAGRSVRYAFQPSLNGTADALHAARPLLGERFMVLMGDDLYTRADLALLVRHRHAILGMQREDVYGTGAIVCDDHHLRAVTEAFPRHEPGIVNTGAYMLTQAFFDYTPVCAGNSCAQEVGLPQTLAQMAQKEAVTVCHASAWMQITAPEDLDTARERITEFL